MILSLSTLLGLCKLKRESELDKVAKVVRKIRGFGTGVTVADASVEDVKPKITHVNKKTEQNQCPLLTCGVKRLLFMSHLIHWLSRSSVMKPLV